MTATPVAVTIAPATAEDIFDVADLPKFRWMRNRGPNDATVKTGGTASGAAGEFTLSPGERFDPPYRTTLKVSAHSVDGCVIEGEEWS